MFFIGIFGVESKSKEIKEFNNIICKECGRYGAYKLIKKYSFFHFFFIPIFRWGQEYLLLSRCCNSLFAISKEKGKRLEAGEDLEIDFSDLTLKYNGGGTRISTCPNCRNQVDLSFEFCPHCRIKL